MKKEVDDKNKNLKKRSISLLLIVIMSILGFFIFSIAAEDIFESHYSDVSMCYERDETGRCVRYKPTEKELIAERERQEKVDILEAAKPVCYYVFLIATFTLLITLMLKYDKKNTIRWHIMIAIIVLGFLYLLLLPLLVGSGSVSYKKPILYLYPEEDIDVKINFSNEGILKTTYPKYNDGWEVHVKSDSSITDENGRGYYALYWDEEYDSKVDFSTGFYVKSEDSVKFLEEKLNEIGLTEREANEFIMYWLPKMEENGNNLVHFEFTKDREKMNKINIDPKPDSMLRIGIIIKKVDKKVKIKEQKIEHFDRVGFSVVEWGGTIIN